MHAPADEPARGPSRPLLPLALGALLALAGCGRERRPNVVLVTLDTTRADFLSAYGRRSVQTPRFDALAEEGVRFERALSASAVTPVSHATILTGLYPYRHHLRVLAAGSGDRLPADVPTLATRFHDAGYTTLAVHSAFPVSDNWGFGRAFDVFESFDGSMQATANGAAWDVTELQRRSDDTTSLALARLAGVREPFFLWVHYWDPHDPWLYPPDELLEGIPRVDGHPKPGSETYAREVHYMDSQFGRLVDGLRADGRYDRTVVAVTADHGEGLEDGLERHAWAAHRMLYQEQIWVPLLLRVPGGPVRRVVPELVSTVDIAPTLLDYAGLPAGDLDGRSLRPLVEGRVLEPRVLYADQINGYDQNAKMVEKRPDAAFLYCAIDAEGWKLIYKPHDPAASELYHLTEDPDERDNRYAERADVVERLLEDLAKRNPWVLAPFPDEGEDDVSGQLSALGYAAGAVSDVEWSWTCPEHPDVREPERGRHECGRILVPVRR